jgi:hypothetical protein
MMGAIVLGVVMLIVSLLVRYAECTYPVILTVIMSNVVT